MPSLNGARLAKPPTRRQLAETVLRTLPVVNGHSQNMDVLKGQLEALTAEWRSFQALTRWQRLKWMLAR